RKVLIPTRETSEMTITAVAGHTFLEFLVREMGDQFREHEPASMHPPLSAEGGNSLAAPIFAVLDFKSFPPKKPPPSTIERTCGISQSTLPDTSDFISLALQPGRHPPATVKRRSRVLFVEQSHQQQILFALAHRLIVEAGPVHAQQLALPPNAELGMRQLHQRAPVLNRADQLFF